MLEDSAPVALITQSNLRQLFPDFDHNVKVLDISAENPPWNSQPENNPDAAAMGLHSGSLAHVIYTSGSTGTPKGVLIEHHYLRMLARWFVRECSLTHEYVSFPATSFCFAPFYKNVYAPLFIGGQIHLVRNHKDPNELLSIVSRSNIRLLNVTPTTFAMLLDADSSGILSKIQTIVLVGEPIQLHKLSMLPIPRPDVINTYGQLESGLVSFHRIPTDCDLSTGKMASIGRPMPHVRVYILNGEGDPVPDGAEGELYIGGANMSRGYLNRPDLNAERFLPDPFCLR